MYDLPDHDLARRSERGEVVLGGCVLFGGEPDFRCESCRHEWVDGPLPPWWPPSDVERMDPWDREISADRLDRQYRRVRDVAVAVLDEPLRVARGRLTEIVGDSRSDLDDVFDGLVVPSDRVLQAEVLNTAAAVCRALAAANDEGAADLVEMDSRYAALDAAVDTFRRADREYPQRGDVDVLQPLEDEEDWLCDEDRGEPSRRFRDGRRAPVPWGRSGTTGSTPPPPPSSTTAPPWAGCGTSGPGSRRPG